jgi:hypothetical protein
MNIIKKIFSEKPYTPKKLWSNFVRKLVITQKEFDVRLLFNVKVHCTEIQTELNVSRYEKIMANSDFNTNYHVHRHNKEVNVEDLFMRRDDNDLLIKLYHNHNKYIKDIGDYVKQALDDKYILRHREDRNVECSVMEKYPVWMLEKPLWISCIEPSPGYVMVLYKLDFYCFP